MRCDARGIVPQTPDDIRQLLSYHHQVVPGPESGARVPPVGSYTYTGISRERRNPVPSRCDGAVKTTRVSFLSLRARSAPRTRSTTPSSPSFDPSPSERGWLIGAALSLYVHVPRASGDTSSRRVGARPGPDVRPRIFSPSGRFPVKASSPITFWADLATTAAGLVLYVLLEYTRWVRVGPGGKNRTSRRASRRNEGIILAGSCRVLVLAPWPSAQRSRIQRHHVYWCRRGGWNGMECESLQSSADRDLLERRRPSKSNPERAEICGLGKSPAMKGLVPFSSRSPQFIALLPVLKNPEEHVVGIVMSSFQAHRFLRQPPLSVVRAPGIVNCASSVRTCTSWYELRFSKGTSDVPHFSLPRFLVGGEARATWRRPRRVTTATPGRTAPLLHLMTMLVSILAFATVSEPPSTQYCCACRRSLRRSRLHERSGTM